MVATARWHAWLALVLGAAAMDLGCQSSSDAGSMSAGTDASIAMTFPAAEPRMAGAAQATGGAPALGSPATAVQGPRDASMGTGANEDVARSGKADASQPARPDREDADAGLDPRTDALDPSTKSCIDCCPDGFARGPSTLELTPILRLTPSPEGVAVCPDGSVFITVDGPDEIRRVPLDGGEPEVYASLAGIQPAGIDCDAHGRLFVAGFSRRNGSPAPPILLIAARGATPLELPAPQGGMRTGGLNGIVAVPGVGVFASDTAGGVLWHAREAADGRFEVRAAATDLVGANGMMFDSKTRRLYLARSFLPPQVVSLAVNPDGTLGEPKQEIRGSALALFDGVAVDEAGDVYIADYLGGAVLRARDAEPIAKLSVPASFAFRGGTLLVTSYYLNDPKSEGGLYSLRLGACGARRWQ